MPETDFKLSDAQLARILQRECIKFAKEHSGERIQDTFGELFVKLMKLYTEVTRVERSDFKY